MTNPQSADTCLRLRTSIAEITSLLNSVAISATRENREPPTLLIRTGQLIAAATRDGIVRWKSEVNKTCAIDGAISLVWDPQFSPRVRDLARPTESLGGHKRKSGAFDEPMQMEIEAAAVVFRSISRQNKLHPPAHVQPMGDFEQLTCSLVDEEPGTPFQPAPFAAALKEVIPHAQSAGPYANRSYVQVRGSAVFASSASSFAGVTLPADSGLDVVFSKRVAGKLAVALSLLGRLPCTFSLSPGFLHIKNKQEGIRVPISAAHHDEYERHLARRSTLATTHQGAALRRALSMAGVFTSASVGQSPLLMEMKLHPEGTDILIDGRELGKLKTWPSARRDEHFLFGPLLVEVEVYAVDLLRAMLSSAAEAWKEGVSSWQGEINFEFIAGRFVGGIMVMQFRDQVNVCRIAVSFQNLRVSMARPELRGPVK